VVNSMTFAWDVFFIQLNSASLTNENGIGPGNTNSLRCVR
jgi:hypothetical protein